MALNIWDKLSKSLLSIFFKGCLPQNLHSPLLHTLSHNNTPKLVDYFRIDIENAFLKTTQKPFANIALLKASKTLLYCLYWRQKCLPLNIWPAAERFYFWQNVRLDKIWICFSPLSANPTKWSNILKQFVSDSRVIVSVCLTILWG